MEMTLKIEIPEGYATLENALQEFANEKDIHYKKVTLNLKEGQKTLYVDSFNDPKEFFEFDSFDGLLRCLFDSKQYWRFMSLLSCYANYTNKLTIKDFSTYHETSEDSDV